MNRFMMVGVFVIAGLALFTTGLFMIGNRHENSGACRLPGPRKCQVSQGFCLRCILYEFLCRQLLT